MDTPDWSTRVVRVKTEKKKDVIIKFTQVEFLDRAKVSFNS